MPTIYNKAKEIFKGDTFNEILNFLNPIDLRIPFKNQNSRRYFQLLNSFVVGKKPDDNLIMQDITDNFNGLILTGNDEPITNYILQMIVSMIVRNSYNHVKFLVVSDNKIFESFQNTPHCNIVKSNKIDLFISNLLKETFLRKRLLSTPEADNIEEFNDYVVDDVLNYNFVIIDSQLKERQTYILNQLIEKSKGTGLLFIIANNDNALLHSAKKVIFESKNKAVYCDNGQKIDITIPEISLSKIELLVNYIKSEYERLISIDDSCLYNENWVVPNEVNDEGAKKVASFIKNQIKNPEEIQFAFEIFQMIVNTGKTDARFFTSYFNIGYPRASRLINIFRQSGCISIDHLNRGIIHITINDLNKIKSHV